MSELPKGWVEAELGDTSSVQWGNTGITKKAYLPSGYTAFSASGPDGFLEHFEHDGEGIVLSAIGARCGKCFKSDGKWTAIKNTITITESYALRDFLYFYVNNPRRWPNKGGAQPFITLGAARNLKHPLPPLAEQKRIVGKLDALSAKSARARDHLSRIETLTKRYKQSVLSKAFSRELTKDWRKVEIQDLCLQAFDGPFGSNLKSSDYTSAGPRIIRLENIGARTFISDKETHVSAEKFDSLQKHELMANDLLFSSFVSEEVRACLFPSDAEFRAINKADCFCLRFDPEKTQAQFALFQLSADKTYRFFSKQVHGATRPRINLRQLKSYQLFVPPLEEQTQIVRRIEASFARIDKLAADAKRALALTDRLDEAILAKAFRGELVPQDPNDEPASVLLDRIKAERANAPKPKRRRGKKA